MENVDIENLDFKGKNYGFHFTPQINESGFEKTGLEARIGVNSSGKLGKEAIPKVFFSNGINGALMTFNRMTNIPPAKGSIAMIVKDYYRYLPNRIKSFVPEDKRKLESLTDEDIQLLIERLNGEGIYELDYCESFEFMRDFMSENMYLFFDAEPSRYQNELTSTDIEEINAARNPETLAQIDDLDARIDACEDKEEIARLNRERQILSREVRRQCMEVASQKRGAKLFDGFFDIEDYNEEHCEFLVQPLNNTHSAIKYNGIGKDVPAEQLRKLSTRGRVDAVTLISKMFEQRDSTSEYAMRGKKYDARLIEFFLEYLKLPRDLSQDARDSISSKITAHTKTIRGILKQRKGFTGILPEEESGIEDILCEMRKYREEPLISMESVNEFANEISVNQENENASEAIDSLVSAREQNQIQNQEQK